MEYLRSLDKAVMESKMEEAVIFLRTAERASQNRIFNWFACMLTHTTYAPLSYPTVVNSFFLVFNFSQ